MKQNYFILNGKKYCTGTVLIINDLGTHVEATFICYDTERERYVYKIKGRPGRNACTCFDTQIGFFQKIVSITGTVDSNAHLPVTKTLKDTEIDGLFIGWLWYIFLMAISTIFYDRIGLWILISVVFFSWRKKKIKENGTYTEW